MLLTKRAHSTAILKPIKCVLLEMSKMREEVVACARAIVTVSELEHL